MITMQLQWVVGSARNMQGEILKAPNRTIQFSLLSHHSFFGNPNEITSINQKLGYGAAAKEYGDSFPVREPDPCCVRLTSYGPCLKVPLG